MKHQKCIELIDTSIEEPNSLNSEWVECLLVCRRLLQKEIDHEQRLKDYGLEGRIKEC